MAGYPQPQKYVANNGKVFQYDARDKLAIEEVEAKCTAIVDAAKAGCDTICKEIADVQIGKETLCVADSSLEPALDEISKYIKYRLYSFRVWQNKSMIRDMYPCYLKSDSQVVGMYDLIGNQFYGNDGTGIFYKGPDVN